MQKETVKSLRVLVFAVLSQHPGRYFSVRELITELFENHNTNTNPNGIADALAELRRCNPFVISQVERRGIKKQPVNTYSFIHTNTEIQC